MLRELSINEVISKIADNNPTPGGGSASALASAIGAALVGMFGAFTVNKEAYQALNENEKNSFENDYNKLNSSLNRLMELVEEDMHCYPAILAANALPKETKEDIEIRKASKEAATIHAIEIPLEIMKVSYSCIKAASNMLMRGNRNLITDLLGGIILLNAGLESASLNVFINLQYLHNLDLKAQYYSEANDIVRSAREVKDSIVEAYKPR